LGNQVRKKLAREDYKIRKDQNVKDRTEVQKTIKPQGPKGLTFSYSIHEEQKTPLGVLCGDLKSGIKHCKKKGLPSPMQGACRLTF